MPSETWLVYRNKLPTFTQTRILQPVTAGEENPRTPNPGRHAQLDELYMDREKGGIVLTGVSRMA